MNHHDLSWDSLPGMVYTLRANTSLDTFANFLFKSKLGGDFDLHLIALLLKTS